MKLGYVAMFAGLMALSFVPQAKADDETYTLTMKNGAFEPAGLKIPANKKIHLIVKNENSKQVEFESYELDIEEKINSGESTDIYIKPLDAGSYPIFDDKNPDTKGEIIAK